MATENFIIPGRMNMIIDGQFGSTGKGLLAARIATDNHIDVACARLSPNAGHTFYVNNVKYVTRQLPVAGILQKKSTIYIGFGSVVDVSLLLKEMDEFDIDPSRLIIHPRTAVITDSDMLTELGSGVKRIASTLSGTGGARSSKILRQNPLAYTHHDLMKFCSKHIDVQTYLDEGLNVLAETGQGFDLSINLGIDYPHCTSTDITPSAVLADFGLHPSYMGNCFMTIRTFPIRVGNIIEDNQMVGFSGQVYPDSNELSWEELHQLKEHTTCTNRVRRVFTFSKSQYLRSLRVIKPTHIFLNFINYLREEDLTMWENGSLPLPTHVGYGRHTENICPYESFILQNTVYKSQCISCA